MAQLIVRNLDDDIKERLTQRAQRHGRSTEDEARDILRAAALADVAAETAPQQGLGTRIAARFAGLGLDADIAECHEAQARPADLG
jgi:antitoxin FitA